MSKSRNQLAKELLLREENIKCANCLEAKSHNENGMCHCNEWRGKVDLNDFCSYFNPKEGIRNDK